MIKLIKPTPKYKASFIVGRKEFQREEKTPLENIKRLEQDFYGFQKQMRNYKRGKNLQKGYVPSSYYWLMDNAQWIGETTIRHRLNARLRRLGGHIGYAIRPTKRKMGYGTKILELALQKAKKLGIQKVFVTCDDKNTASRKIIEKNGGVLKNKIKSGKRFNNKLIRRYRITIK